MFYSLLQNMATTILPQCYRGQEAKAVQLN